MIDRDLLHQLGWPNELVEAVIQVAEPLRETASRTSTVGTLPTIQSVSCSAFFTNGLATNTTSGFRVEDPKKSNPEK